MLGGTIGGVRKRDQGVVSMNALAADDKRHPAIDGHPPFFDRAPAEIKPVWECGMKNRGVEFRLLRIVFVLGKADVNYRSLHFEHHSVETKCRLFAELRSSAHRFKVSLWLFGVGRALAFALDFQGDINVRQNLRREAKAISAPLRGGERDQIVCTIGN